MDQHHRDINKIEIPRPDWVNDIAPLDKQFDSPEARMRVAIELSRENIRRGYGGPFGAAVYEFDTGRLVAAGVNSVVPLDSSSLHAEVVALMFAQKRIGSFTLADDQTPGCELVTSCDPCAMCLGATLWSGVKRLVCGASRDDAMACGFDEGPVFDESYRYLENRGIEIVRGVLRAEAAAVLRGYVVGGGRIYNG